MGEAYGTIVAIMISVYMMFIMPLNNMIYENEKLEQMYIVNEITYFVENVRNTGNISEDMYIGLTDKLVSMNSLYNIGITHYKNIYNEDGSEILYFEEEKYLYDIEDELQQNGIYYLKKNEYIKITVTKGDNMVACYGGSIKNENNGL